MERLKHFRQKISFLRKVPDELYFKLDPTGFYLPGPAVDRLRKKLERQIEHHVMTYERSIFDITSPLETHLCAIIKGADLTRAQLNHLNEAEELVNILGVSLVVYQKPLTIIDPTSSWIASLYREKGLL